LIGSAVPAFGQFAAGNLVVLRVGDGAAALTSGATPVFLDQFNTSSANQTSPSFTFSMPTTGSFRLTESGSATSAGQLTLNPLGTSVSVPGYDAAVGTAGVVGSSAPRVVNAVDLVGSGGVGVASQLVSTTTSFPANNIRSAFSDGTTTWAVGANTGVVAFPGETVVSNTVVNNRVVNSFNGNLYFSTGSGASRGIYQVGTSGLPDTAGQTSTSIINAGGTASSYAFAINPAGDVAYLADDRTVATGGGIQKWTLSGSTWTLAGTFTNLNGTESARGLAVDFSGANPVLYATTTATQNRLVALTDTGANFTDQFTTLAIAPTNEAFRGVVLFTPVPEPATILGIAAFGAFAVGGLRRRFAK